jgi:arginyl-tRNA synthetase
MNIESLIKKNVCLAIEKLYDKKISQQQIQIKQIPKHLEGDYSVITFPFAKLVGQKPQDIAAALAIQLLQQSSFLANASSAGPGFCNLSIGDAYWVSFVQEVIKVDRYGHHAPNNETVLVEYSSPNTNKPLHLGHIRNNLLGYATAEILKAAGFDVKKVQIINDRGVHICKSMLAWQRWGGGETPESSGMKGDHLVGKYYVAFEKYFREEYAQWQNHAKATEVFELWMADDSKISRLKKNLEKKGKDSNVAALRAHFFKEVYKNKYFNEHSVLGMETKNMLKRWESGDASTLALWNKMNQWVYQGFDMSYNDLGVDFDKLYYESKTYLTGKQLVIDNLEQKKSCFFRKEDGSVWIDLSKAKLDEKVVLRKDGTSMYITQDIGTATLRHKDFRMDRMVYVVANEQDYHFKVLFETLKRLGYTFADQCHHLSYGMVNLTTGKMKSREGTVVDADNLLADIIADVQQESEERQKLKDLTLQEKRAVWKEIALSALKFYILKVEPKKTMVFDPQQSIELQGQTGPYIQNAFVRTQSVQRMVGEKNLQLTDFDDYTLTEVERDILVLVHELPAVVLKAAKAYNPSDVAHYLYDLAKEYHKFWGSTTIIDTQNTAATSFRIALSKAVAVALQNAGKMIGISMPKRM